MKIIDVYTKKEYKCPKCKEPIYYAKVANDSGVLYTTDGNTPNGKFGKDSNVLTCQVDALVKDRVHGCSKAELEGKLLGPLDKIVEPPKVKEMTVSDVAEPRMRKEIENNLKILKIVEEEVIKFIGTDARGDKIGMWMKLVQEMMKK